MLSKCAYSSKSRELEQQQQRNAVNRVAQCEPRLPAKPRVRAGMDLRNEEEIFRLLAAA